MPPRTRSRGEPNLELERLPVGVDRAGRVAEAEQDPMKANPLEYAKLVALVKTYDPNLETLKDSAAKNWTLIDNRMAFIADLFRSRQQDTSLFGPPFTKAQLDILAQGRVPPGPL